MGGYTVFEVYGLMERKLRGVEHELAMNTRPSLPHSSLVHLVGMAIEELKKKGLVTKIPVEEPRLDFMAYNGFRVYNDMSHLELSSPSYNTPMEAVIYDRVCELFTYYAAEGLRSYFKSLDAYKNNVSNQKDSEGWRAVSYSTHTSILMDRGVCNLGIWDKVEEALVPYMVTRILLTGGGDYVPVKGDGGFARPGKIMKGESLGFTISPRAAFIKRVSSNDTVDARGLLNQRDDPHADPEKYWRLHDINWEGVRSPYQIYLRDCLEALVMTAYERGYYRNPPVIVDPVNAIKELTFDTEALDWKVNLEDGGKVDALEDVLEGFYLAGVEEMLSGEESSEHDQLCFKLIEATINGLEERSLEYFVDGLDWVTKKALVDEYAEGSVEDAMGVCNQFSLIDGTVQAYIGEPVSGEAVTAFSWEDGLDFARSAVPWEDWDSLESRVSHALRNSPEGSREYIRGLVAREFPNLVESIEWERIRLYNIAINLGEPFRFNRAMCGDRLEEATRTFTTFTTALREIEKSEDLVIYAPSLDHEKEENK